MNIRRYSVFTAIVLAASTALPACAQQRSPQSVSTTATSEAAPAAAAVPANNAMPLLVVHKSPYCGCCGLWVEHMHEAGFAVEVRNVANVNPIKQRVGVPLAKGSCHTAQVGKYFIEGHVPAGDVKRLLAEQPDAKGLVVPGMPKGSPGMEVPDGSIDAYTVELVANDGSTSVFAQHGE
ncbi:MAG: DUF411 domain-containing protein [Lysobacter sp.]